MAAATAKESSSGGDGCNIKGLLTHGGRYVQYNVYGNLFEVSSKYVPPIRPIGRGAYGIVWLALSSFSFRCIYGFIYFRFRTCYGFLVIDIYAVISFY